MPPTKYRLPSLGDTGSMVRLAVIGILIVIFASSFAYVAGWSPPAC